MAAESQSKSTKIDELLDLKMLEERKIFFCSAVDMDSVKDAIRKLWYLEAEAPGKPILLIINSPGGSVDAGFALWDQIKMISSPVATLVTGMAASMGSVLSIVAEKGKRFATRNCRIMIHQPRISGVIQGQATDIEIHAKEILKTRENLIQLYMEATGKDYETVAKALDRDTWLSAEEAKAFGLIDKIVDSHKDLKLS